MLSHFFIKQKILICGFLYKFTILFLLTLAALYIIGKDFTKINLMTVSILKSQFLPNHHPLCHTPDWFENFIPSHFKCFLGQ